MSVENGNVRIAVATGNADIYVAGNADLMVDKNVTATVGGNMKADITGTTDVTSQGHITVTGPAGTTIISDTKIDGTLNVTKTTHSVGDVSTDAGNAPTLATHTHTDPSHVKHGSETSKPN